MYIRSETQKKFRENGQVGHRLIRNEINRICVNSVINMLCMCMGEIASMFHYIKVMNMIIPFSLSASEMKLV